MANTETIVGKVVGGRYVIVRKMGCGAFGTIYLAEDVIEKGCVAIKLETRMDGKRSQLEHEMRIYQMLSTMTFIPKIRLFVQEDGNNMLVMELLGSSLEELFVRYKRQFSLKTVLMLADQMIKCLEMVHHRHLIHRDIKPDNFVIGMDDPAKVYIVDFGLAKRYRRAGTWTHIPFRDKKSLTGTARYASISTHQGYEQSRRDDMESLGYVLIYLLKGSLPWQGLKGAKPDKYRKIHEKKVSISIEELCQDLPLEFQKYLHHVRELSFEERPDYDHLRRLFRDVFHRHKYRRDHVYEWTESGSEKEKEIRSECSWKRVHQQPCGFDK